MLHDVGTFLLIVVRIVKRDATREDLAEMARGLRRIASGEISQGFVGRWKPKRVSQILRTVTRLARRLAENDDLLVLLNQLPHERNDPVAMLAFAVNLLDVPRHGALLSAVAIEIPEAPVGANHSFVEGHRPFGSPQHPPTKPPFEPVRISNHRTQTDDLPSHPVPPSPPPQTQTTPQP